MEWARNRVEVELWLQAEIERHGCRMAAERAWSHHKDGGYFDLRSSEPAFAEYVEETSAGRRYTDPDRGLMIEFTVEGVQDMAIDLPLAEILRRYLADYSEEEA